MASNSGAQPPSDSENMMHFTVQNTQTPVNTSGEQAAWDRRQILEQSRRHLEFTTPGGQSSQQQGPTPPVGQQLFMGMGSQGAPQGQSSVGQQPLQNVFQQIPQAFQQTTFQQPFQQIPNQSFQQPSQQAFQQAFQQPFTQGFQQPFAQNFPQQSQQYFTPPFQQQFQFPAQTPFQQQTVQGTFQAQPSVQETANALGQLLAQLMQPPVVPPPPPPLPPMLANLLAVMQGKTPTPQSVIPDSNTQFHPAIASVPLPLGATVPAMLGTYDGTTDPEDFIQSYDHVIKTQHWEDAVACQMFPSVLRSYAKSWF